MSGSDLSATTELGRSSAGLLREPDPSEVPYRVGRYVVLSRLGAGAMGVVLAAYDEELDRKVAIKLLQPGLARDAGFVARMRREGQALARVSHPNIVGVYEVGLDEGLLYLVMEFVDGRTLEQWSSRDHDWRSVLGVHLQAARGLAAAHRAGLVHRDYKPANAILGDDGRVRVLDFGLARRFGGKAELGSREDDSGSSLDDPRSPSATDAFMGTPRYMSPEQFLGHATSARSDQFSFCVALYEALHGEPPFSGESPAQIGARVIEGEIRSPPPSSDVPALVSKALRQGLAPTPKQRWPDMDALVEALEPALRGTKRGRLFALGAAVLAGLGFAYWGGRSSEAPCQGSAAATLRAWNPEAATRIQDSLRATGVPYAEDAARGTVQRLEDYVERWRGAHRDACEDTALRHQQSGELLDLRMACLERRLDAVAALVVSIEEADPSASERVIESVGELPDLEPCADAEHLLALLPPPEDPALARDVANLRRDLARAKAARKLGGGASARALVQLEELGDAIEATGYSPLLAEYDFELGASFANLDRLDLAEERLESAYYRAVAIGHDPIAIRGAMRLAHTIGYGKGEVDRGLHWGRLAQAEVEHAGTPMELAKLLETIGLLWSIKGEYELALVQLEQSLEMRESITKDGISPEIADTLMEIGGASVPRGDLTRANASYDRALEIRKTLLGAQHPDVAVTMGNIATVRLNEGRYEEAEALLVEGLEIYRAVYGSRTTLAASFEVDLGTVAAMRGDLERAAVHFETAVREFSEILGRENPRVSAVEINLASIFLAKGDHRAARPLLEHAHANLVARHGDTAPELVELLHNLALVDFAEGDHAAAVDKSRQVIALREATSSRQHPDVLSAMAVLGEALLALGKVDDAQANIEEGLRICEEIVDEIDPIYCAQLELLLAIILEQRGVDRVHALSLARGAHAVLEPRGELVAETLEQARELIERLEGQAR